MSLSAASSMEMYLRHARRTPARNRDDKPDRHENGPAPVGCGEDNIRRHLVRHR